MEHIKHIQAHKGFPFHFAGRATAEVEDYLREHNCLRLLSYVNERRDIEKRSLAGHITFVDSGAFSATNRKLSIDVDQYINWLNEWSQHFSMFCCWDTIPVGDMDPEESAKKTWDNYCYMKERLNEPQKLIYCYHYGEDIKWLEQAIREGVKMIALGGIAKRGKNQRREFLTKVRPILEANPDVFVHAFGMTSWEILKEYDYINSADSTSWICTTKYGQINTDLGLVYVGEDRTRKNHYEDLTKEQKEIVKAGLAEVGLTDETFNTSTNRLLWQAHHWRKRMLSFKYDKENE